MTQRTVVAFIHSCMPDGGLDPFMTSLLEAFANAEVRVHYIKTNDLVWGLGQNRLAHFIDEKKILDFVYQVEPDFILSMNRGGIPQSLIDKSPCPIINWLVDIEPFMHHKGTKENLYGDRDFILTASSSNVALLENAYPQLKGRIFFVPFATTLRAFDQTVQKEKDIPVSFVGSYFLINRLSELFQHFEKDPVTYENLKKLMVVLASAYETDATAESEKLGLGKALQSAGFTPDTFKQFVAHAVSNNKRIDILNALTQDGLHFFGTSNWRAMTSVSLPLFNAFDPTPIVTSAQLVDVYQRSKISLNISHQQAMGGLPYRVFDIMASNSMLLAGEESRQDLELLFGKDMPLPLYRDATHAHELASYYLAHESERQTIVDKCHALVQNDFDFKDRVEHMYEIACPDLSWTDRAGFGEVVPIPAVLFQNAWGRVFCAVTNKTPKKVRDFIKTLVKQVFSFLLHKKV